MPRVRLHEPKGRSEKSQKVSPQHIVMSCEWTRVGRREGRVLKEKECTAATGTTASARNKINKWISTSSINYQASNPP